MADKIERFEDLVGLTLSDVTGATPGSERIVLETVDGRTFSMWHTQDCCETVSVEDVVGDVSDLLNAPIVLAEESTSDERPSDLPEPEWNDESQTWTFYRLGTHLGTVVIRWYGSSNGYYSESVYFGEE